MSNSDQMAAAKALSAIFRNIGDKTTSHEQQMIATSVTMMRKLVAPLLSQMKITEKTSVPLILLDSACGTGVFTQEVQATLSRDVLDKSTFLCSDNSEGMISLVKKRVEAEGWVHTESRTLNAMNTGLAENSFTHVGIALGLHLIPDPDAVLADCKRILKPNGMFGATTFHANNTFWIPDVRSAFASFPFPAPFPAQVRMQMHDQGDWTDPEWIATHLRELGLADVEVTVNPGTYRIKNADEFLNSFGMMFAWMMNTWWDEETRKEHPPEEVRELVGKHLVEKYGGEGWDVNWEVICATGRVAK
ncbi:hypothetical protein G7046_g3211 [Stylonectria norvegica]|nr:hypothetical protein G7046_g3211 [Stylonectria norvegica]